MAIAVSWYVNNRILVLKGIRNITDSDLIESDNLIIYHLENSIRRPVHLIIDGSLIETVPNLAVFKRWQWPRHAALGNVAIFGLRNNTLRFVISAIAQLFGLRFSFQDSFIDAVTALTRMDTQLAKTGSLPPIEDALSKTQPVTPLLEVPLPTIPQVLKKQVMEAAGDHCEYCQLPSKAAIDLQIHEVTLLTDGGLIAFDNLVYACLQCRTLQRDNQHESHSGKPIPIFNPRRHVWSEHFRWSEDRLQMVGITPVGMATVNALRLNNMLTITARQVGLEEGWHPPRMTAPAHVPPAPFPEQGKLRLEINDIFTNIVRKIVVMLTEKVVLGRFDPLASQKPDIDLVIFGGYRLHVSRLHAEIKLNAGRVPVIVDLGSTYGTFVNGKRLAPNAHHPLYNGDQLRLGELDIMVYFEN
jgi:hypothetical protein